MRRCFTARACNGRSAGPSGPVPAHALLRDGAGSTGRESSDALWRCPRPSPTGRLPSRSRAGPAKRPWRPARRLWCGCAPSPGPRPQPVPDAAERRLHAGAVLLRGSERLGPLRAVGFRLQLQVLRHARQVARHGALDGEGLLARDARAVEAHHRVGALAQRGVRPVGRVPLDHRGLAAEPFGCGQQSLVDVGLRRARLERRRRWRRGALCPTSWLRAAGRQSWFSVRVICSFPRKASARTPKKWQAPK